MRLLLSLLFLLGVWSRLTYRGEQVLNCKLNADSVKILEDSLDVWGIRADRTVDVRVKTPKERQLVESLLEDCNVYVEDIEELVLAEEAANLEAKAKANAEWFDAYHTYDELKAWYRDFAATNPGVTFIDRIGVTSEGRDIFALLISVSGDLSKPSVYFQSLIHAREWIGGATTNYIVNQLFLDRNAGVEPARSILQDSNIYFVPITNPDGYAYTLVDRQWRKNRRVNAGSTCRGVDNNRNYPDHWGQGGSSNLACSDTYMGPSAGSEAETQATTSFFANAQKNAPVYVAFDWHSYSQLVLRPYGWTKTPSCNETYLKTLGDAYAQDVYSVSRMVYTSQPSIDLYVTTGSASDWFYGDNATIGNTRDGKTYYGAASYTVELRPTTSNPGFVLPPNQIIPTGQENYFAFTNLIRKVLDQPVIRTTYPGC